MAEKNLQTQLKQPVKTSKMGKQSSRSIKAAMLGMTPEPEIKDIASGKGGTVSK